MTLNPPASPNSPSSAWGGLDDAGDRADILIVDDLPEKLLVFETVLGDLKQNLNFSWIY